ncbi:pre-miRNA 5'-monophosphate methyltransferase [Leptopilina boulardi]|uniref:pre-miRNA 5'-monophosphate methyltransferase n=1 Tax=Leptopilina boulardi TaxID=63433 RepID=UPI0021F59577|nr:pre-miRNA 5'-monophosphate methyltransferase [Leptopilina boulardi]
MKEEKEKNVDPEGHRYGNFLNYYNFHSAEERIQQLPLNIWNSSDEVDYKFSALDIGCNSGNLSCLLYNFLQDNVSPKDKCKISLLGIDLDSKLIDKAQLQCPTSSVIKFECLDFLSQDREQLISDHLKSINKSKFNVAFCFSITMWIHLNHGDEGLIKFLKTVCEISDMIVIEPQQWKSYRNASRRLRKANVDDFLLLNKLKLKGDMYMHIAKILKNECNFSNVTITNENNWQRRLLIYKRKS